MVAQFHPLTVERIAHECRAYFPELTQWDRFGIVMACLHFQTMVAADPYEIWRVIAQAIGNSKRPG